MGTHAALEGNLRESLGALGVGNVLQSSGYLRYSTSILKTTWQPLFFRSVGCSISNEKRVGLFTYG